jgi:hypothetical protein
VINHNILPTALTAKDGDFRPPVPAKAGMILIKMTIAFLLKSGAVKNRRVHLCVAYATRQQRSPAQIGIIRAVIFIKDKAGQQKK